MERTPERHRNLLQVPTPQQLPKTPIFINTDEDRLRYWEEYGRVLGQKYREATEEIDVLKVKVEEAKEKKGEETRRGEISALREEVESLKEQLRELKEKLPQGQPPMHVDPQQGPGEQRQPPVPLALGQGTAQQGQQPPPLFLLNQGNLIGQRFDSFDSFKAAMEPLFQDGTYMSARRMDENNHTLKYKNFYYHCIKFGNGGSQRSQRIGCAARIYVSQKNKKLQIMSGSVIHNHP